MECQIVTNQIFNWYPEKFLNSNYKNCTNFAVMILNRPILLEKKLMKHLWNESEIRITVDGGTNRWLEFLVNCDDFLKKPDIVSGDFDSITEDSLKFIRDFQIKILKTTDQNETDFTKALRVLSLISSKNLIRTVLVITENSGRLDQIMANINTLFKASSIWPAVNVFLLSSNSMSWLLTPGTHNIEIPRYILNKKLWCSLIPIGEKCYVTTKGLKWDLDNDCLEFGQIVSTSNTYSGSKNVIISTAGCLLWSMGIFSIDDE